MTYTAMISGAGISGISCAIALRKAGIEAVVYEGYDRTADDVGAFLTLAVNALDALRALDFDVRRLGFETPRIRLTSASGRLIGDLPYGRVLRDGAASRTVKRAELYRALREHAARQGVRIEYGKRLTHARDTGDTGDGVVATFADGTTASGDLLIGADGLRSRTRELIDPAAPGVRYSGLVNVGGYARGVPAGGDPGTMHAIFGSRAFFAYAAHAHGEVWWAANLTRAAEPTAAELAMVGEQDWRAELMEVFRRDHGPAVAFIEATDRILAPWTAYDVPVVPRWHRGRMIIIGDAAHATVPSIGQGAAMAIEDAVVLAKCLRDATDFGAAFAAYERLRRERVERVVAQGRRTDGWKTPGPLTRIPRDLIMSLAMKRMARTGHDPNHWIYEHHIDWDEPARQSG
ncbi:FAD-dependent monooxygenase [Spongiactinospora sp. TRM90649]|uniref:FAD-dependent monooxygenase n=1 Tax=Spongiactinospora sp. TRM90649 TaxID=3031114 RepID=UPI0023F96F68|nr:FAD-dependent monooxygenase [Spongiactinospora sp. TRM90649]MDF5754360.1 FAD-dependent monooxygenase [Spongiactinospora sp. TRM90649]